MSLDSPKLPREWALNRKTAYEHIKAAELRMNQLRSSERRKARRQEHPRGVAFGGATARIPGTGRR